MELEIIRNPNRKKIEYEVDGSGWPDAIFHIFFANSVGENEVCAVNFVFKGFMKKLFDACPDIDDEDAQILHYVSEAEFGDEDNIVSIHVDFGRCGEDVLEMLIGEISRELKGAVYVFVE